MTAAVDRSSRDRLDLRAGLAYIVRTETAWPAPPRAAQPVAFRHVAPARARATLTVLAAVTGATGLAFMGWLLLPNHVPGRGVLGFGEWELTVSRVSLCLVIALELIRLTQNVAVWIFALKAKDPVPMAPPVDLRVALLTTIPPSPERIDAVERALRGLKDIVYRGPVDIWIVDDGADPTVAAMTERLGFEYISGHESWRADHEHRYDVVARIDPDHVPMPSFLESTLGYFDDPDVAFVVARLLVGTNHLYRPAAWRQTGTDPDPVTAVHTTTNPRTGRHWKGVYAPDVTTVGEGWMSWADYLDQHRHSPYEGWEILRTPGPDTPARLLPRRAAFYGLVRRLRRNLAATLLASQIAAATYLVFGITSIEMNSLAWLTLWGVNMGSWFVLWLWLRGFRTAGDQETGDTWSAASPMPAAADPARAAT